ncbi:MULTISPECIES: hypothetical protein [unclassified Streptomyces]|uniref:hypothetical protein n=1 Tax=unclassified Streptomyces TaxID=2593676 RepID=UPI002035E948|nr:MULTISPECIES: hypothetical protein [unclassified Streptomyces]
MMMNSVPQHLLSEDRREYERILDEALRSAPHRPELAAVGQRLNPEQLRTMALNATALITAAAATEYQHYVRLREELRQPAPSTPSFGREPGSAGSRAGAGAGAMGLATSREEAAYVLPGPVAVAFSRILMAVLGFGRRGGRGTKPTPQQQRRMPFGRRLLAALLGVRTRPVVSQVTRAEAVEQLVGKLSRSARTLSVLAGFLGVLATLLCLLVGYVLKEFGAAASTAQALVTTGWILGVATTIPILPAIVGVVLTARRNRADFGDGPYGELSEEVARAREAWLEALLERGILPFLREALADPGTTSALHRTPPPTPTGRISNLGYDRPGFSSQDFGGPEHRSE